MATTMKETGKEWIGTIPKHWKLKRIKHIISQTKDGIKIGPFGSALTNKTQDKGEYNVYSQANLIASDFSTTKNTIDAETFESLQTYEVYPDDICLSMMGTIGKCKKVPSDIKRGIMDSHLIKIRLSDSIDSRYFEYVYDKDLGGICFQQMQFDKKGFIMDGLNTSIVKNLYFPAPPLEEQITIADFLDSECARIDGVIERTRVSIEEYKKLKQALITKAVTKGIRPDSTMKESGIEWIGTIPKDWKICKLRHIGSTQNGISKGGEYFGEGNPFVSYGDVYRNYSLPFEVNGLIRSTEEEQNLYSVERGDIFFTRTSETIEEVGFSSVCLQTIPNATFAGFLIRVRPYDDTLDINFSKYYFRSNHHRFYLVKQMNLVTRASLGQQLLKGMPVLIPCKEEQKEIASYLDTVCADIDELIIKKEALIAELEKMRKSIIYEYVTGKKEVPLQ